MDEGTPFACCGRWATPFGAVEGPVEFCVGAGFLTGFFLGAKMLTGAFLRTAGAWPDGVTEDGPEGGFAGEALMLEALTRAQQDSRRSGR